MTAQDQQSHALAPCPFCGSADTTLEHVGGSSFEAFCEHCGASGPIDSEQWRAAKGWNARALPAGIEPVAQVSLDHSPFGGGCSFIDKGVGALPSGTHDLFTAAQVQAMGRVPAGWQEVERQLLEALKQALYQMEHDAEKIEGEWGVGRKLAEMEADEDLPEVIIRARAAIAKATRSAI